MYKAQCWLLLLYANNDSRDRAELMLGCPVSGILEEEDLPTYVLMLCLDDEA